MNTVEKIKEICKERKIPISKLERDCGFANGYIGQLKKGSIPSDRLMKVSEYLELSPSYLLDEVTDYVLSAPINSENPDTGSSSDEDALKKIELILESRKNRDYDSDSIKRISMYAFKLLQNEDLLKLVEVAQESIDLDIRIATELLKNLNESHQKK